MSGLALFNLAIGDGDPADGASADRTPRLAERLVDASLGNLRYLQEELDAAHSPAPGRPFDRRTAVLLRATYEEWGREAYRVRFVVPPSLPAGRYFLAATVNVAALGDITASDGFVVSESVLAISG